MGSFCYARERSDILATGGVKSAKEQPVRLLFFLKAYLLNEK